MKWLWNIIMQWILHWIERSQVKNMLIENINALLLNMPGWLPSEMTSRWINLVPALTISLLERNNRVGRATMSVHSSLLMLPTTPDNTRPTLDSDSDDDGECDKCAKLHDNWTSHVSRQKDAWREQYNRVPRVSTNVCALVSNKKWLTFMPAGSINNGVMEGGLNYFRHMSQTQIGRALESK